MGGWDDPEIWVQDLPWPKFAGKRFALKISDVTICDPCVTYSYPFLVSNINNFIGQS